MGLGTLVLLANATLLWLYIAVLPLLPARRSAAGSTTSPSTRCATRRGPGSRKLNHSHMMFAWISLFGVALDRPLRLPARHRRHHRPEVLLMAEQHCMRTRASPYDVVVDRCRRRRSAGGDRGARARAPRTAIVCKSLFGKAHTVMAEGGIAAAMGNVNREDNWQVHFRDTMRGGKFLNNWRMAELHAQEAPDRVWELEAWGALFDRTKDGKISQRNFGGHEYPRLAHVGDRTGLELIRTLQQKIVSLQQEDARARRLEACIKVFAECTITELLKDGDGASPAPSATAARPAGSWSSRRPRSSWPPAASASPSR